MAASVMEVEDVMGFVGGQAIMVAGVIKASLAVMEDVTGSVTAGRAAVMLIELETASSVTEAEDVMGSVTAG